RRRRSAISGIAVGDAADGARKAWLPAGCEKMSAAAGHARRRAGRRPELQRSTRAYSLWPLALNFSPFGVRVAAAGGILGQAGQPSLVCCAYAGVALAGPAPQLSTAASANAAAVTPVAENTATRNVICSLLWLVGGLSGAGFGGASPGSARIAHWH